MQQGNKINFSKIHTFSTASDKLKREGSSSSLVVPPSKKLKVGLAGVSRPGIIGAAGSSLLPIDRMTAGPTGVEPWEGLAVDCDIGDVFDKVLQYVQSDNTDRAVSSPST